MEKKFKRFSEMGNIISSSWGRSGYETMEETIKNASNEEMNKFLLSGILDSISYFTSIYFSYAERVKTLIMQFRKSKRYANEKEKKFINLIIEYMNESFICGFETATNYSPTMKKCFSDSYGRSDYTSIDGIGKKGNEILFKFYKKLGNKFFQ